tara:strand:- start:643 stop:1131 length:489 start_codon:yes stop_codon:yes gene_type:complete
MNERGKKAYDLKFSGKTWVEVQKEVGYSNESNTRRAAMRYALMSGEEWPIKNPEKPKRAYMLRKSARLKWTEIAEKLGYKLPEHAHRSAMRYAKRTGADWPLSRYHLCRGEMAYCDLESGASPEDVAEDLGYEDPMLAVRAAYSWARRHDKQWPVKVKKDDS